uniref:Cms1 ribosomal small subunit homolog n=1 Tax=Malurus cyaneus samueli TaxID=2593467 RepID=A0A8C5U3D6_9PASS
FSYVFVAATFQVSARFFMLRLTGHLVKKKISDVLQKSAPKPGVPADLQNLLTQHFGENRSVIELEELKLSDACFLPANDLTHSFSSYLKEICPKWAKLRRNHKEKKSVVMLVLCSSALRSLELIKSMTAFKGDCRVLKLFAKHIKIKEQMNMLEKGVFHIGVGTPGRVKALVEQDALCLTSTKYMILDWNWRDQKLRRMMDIPEVLYKHLYILYSVYSLLFFLVLSSWSVRSFCKAVFSGLQTQRSLTLTDKSVLSGLKIISWKRIFPLLSQVTPVTSVVVL